MSSISTDKQELDEVAYTRYNTYMNSNKRLPSPTDPFLKGTSKMHRNSTDSNRVVSQRVANRQELFDRNRQRKVAAAAALTSSPLSNTDSNNELFTCEEDDIIEHESENNETKVSCDNFERGIAEVRGMIERREDTYAILDKLVTEIAANHVNCKDSIAKIAKESDKKFRNMNAQQVNLENNLVDKVLQVHQACSDRLDGVELTQRCAIEGTSLWLTFIDPQEAENLRLKTKAELITEARKIFARMEIWLTNPSRTIIDVHIQKISCRNSAAGELALCVKFLSSATVDDMRRLISAYSKRQFIDNNLDNIRYRSRDNWSIVVRKFLRICYDLKSRKLIRFVNVKDSGILVSLEAQNGAKPTTALIRNEPDLDDLRKTIGDICPDVPSLQIYDEQYFKMNPADRKQVREARAAAQQNMNGYDHESPMETNE
jgi:hypothetical protein